MQNSAVMLESKSTADVVFDRLFEDVSSLALLPGSKISEAEIARQFGVSRQPVRDAFRRLGNLELLEIRPQRATMVRRFSLEEIANTRFLRLAVELEVIDRACSSWNKSDVEALSQNLVQQSNALDAGLNSEFHDLDYDFHKLICERAGLPKAFETINSSKRKLDRLCVLSVSHKGGASHLLEDHRRIADALANQDTKKAKALTRHHTSRLDETIAEIHETHTHYFR